MGAIHHLPLSDLAQALARAADLKDFVETGTYIGHPIGWAARTFDRVWTIEINAEFQAQAKRYNPAASNVHYRLGDSASELPKVMAELGGPALVWLDAHAGAGHFGSEDNCPLLKELEAILASPFEHCILVDDARAFLAPPPPPFDYRKWPSLDQIFKVLSGRPGYGLVTIADVLIIVPDRHRDVVAQFCFSIRPRI